MGRQAFYPTLDLISGSPVSLECPRSWSWLLPVSRLVSGTERRIPTSRGECSVGQGLCSRVALERVLSMYSINENLCKVLTNV